MHGDHPAVKKWLSLDDYQETYRTLVEKTRADIWQIHGHLDFDEVTPGDWIVGTCNLDFSETYSSFYVVKEFALQAPRSEALKINGGLICTKTRRWFSPSFPQKLHYFKSGERLPNSKGLKVGEVVWYWHPRWNTK